MDVRDFERKRPGSLVSLEVREVEEVLETSEILEAAGLAPHLLRIPDFLD
jgi:hypothetical protein